MNKILIVAVVILIGFNMADFFPPNEDFKRAVEEAMDEILPEKILDLVWNEYFYLFEWLGSVNVVTSQAADSAGDTEEDITLPGIWGTFTGPGNALVSVSSSRVTLTTGTTSGSGAGIEKDPAIQGILRYDRKQRFRTAFQISVITNVTAHLVRGDNNGGNVYYGFKINAGTLQGVTRNGGSETTIDLQSISANTGYDLEARLLPGNKVLFLVRDANNPNTFEPRGVLTTNLPTENPNFNYATIRIDTSNTTSKSLEVSFFEYAQKR